MTLVHALALSAANEPKTAVALHSDANYLNLMTGVTVNISEITVPAQGFYWLKRI